MTCKDCIHKPVCTNIHDSYANRCTEYLNKANVAKAKTEVVKEFAERLKAKEATHFCKCGKPFVYTDLFNGEIDNLVKEMVGEFNDR